MAKNLSYLNFRDQPMVLSREKSLINTKSHVNGN